MAEVPWYDFDDFVYYGSPKDPRFKIEPAQYDEDQSAESDDDPMVKIRQAGQVRKLQRNEVGRIKTTAEVLAENSEMEITAMLRMSGIEKHDDNYRLKSPKPEQANSTPVKGKKTHNTPTKPRVQSKFRVPLHLNSDDFKMVRVSKNDSMESSSSDASFHTAHTTFNHSKNLSTFSQDRTTYTPRELYMKKKNNNDTV